MSSPRHIPSPAPEGAAKHDPEKACPGLDPGWYRFPAFAKPASAGEGRSEKIMLQLKVTVEGVI